MAGGVLSAGWAPAFAAVPRAAFLPEVVWPFGMETGEAVTVSRVDDPRAWHGYADSDVPLVTQWDDGVPAGCDDGRAPGAVATSSSSMPSVVFPMLEDLDVRPGDRVLEVGTGTGWTAALMAHRLGVANVVTVEVDGAVADRARVALRDFGLPVKVVSGDGLKGYPEGGPYDRIIATCGVRGIPGAWLRQIRPGGIIVAPWGTRYGYGDAVARLVVSDDGLSATGPFARPVEFMKARSQRFTPQEHATYVDHPSAIVSKEKEETVITENEFLGERFSPQRFVLGLRLRACTHAVAERAEGGRAFWLYSLTDRSWACAAFRGGAVATVWQSGHRRLWDEARAAYAWWVDQGRPGYERLGLTVDAGGQRAWLDDPAHSWPLRAGAGPCP
ncbi:methyltransferase domain-containing protein [Streptomyces sp. NPDC059452]|uniref:methyltransferase domain-containing protein n=1 Tax=Streptomyces sp. NPDC059452 TaxID=3346835 RepID=UPI0036782362